MNSIPEILARADRPLISFEITPPTRGKSIAELKPTLDTLAGYKPPFIDVTSRASELVYTELDDGTIRKLSLRKRPGTLSICITIQERYGIPSVPHVLCNGFTTQETEDFLIESSFAGIENALALRGDDLDYEKVIRKDRRTNSFAVDLVRQMVGLNQGTYIAGQGDPMKLCIGVAGYPEKHLEAPNFEYDLRMLKEKVDAGASYVVTQISFDNRAFYRFVDQCRGAGIVVPIIPGLKILTKRDQLHVIPKKFNASIPQDLVRRVEQAPQKQGAITAEGVAWAAAQIEDLFSHPEYFVGGKVIAHIYVFGSAQPVELLMKRLGPLSPYAQKQPSPSGQSA